MHRYRSFRSFALLAATFSLACGSDDDDDGYDALFRRLHQRPAAYTAVSVAGRGSGPRFWGAVYAIADDFPLTEPTITREGRCWLSDRKYQTGARYLALDEATLATERGPVTLRPALEDFNYYVTRDVDYALAPAAQVMVTASGLGLPPLSRTLVLPSDAVVASLPPDHSQFDPTRAIEVSWTGASAQTVVELSLSGSIARDDVARSLAITCRSEPGASKATIPISLLAKLPPVKANEAGTNLLELAAGVWHHEVEESPRWTSFHTSSGSSSVWLVY